MDVFRHGFHRPFFMRGIQYGHAQIVHNRIILIRHDLILRTFKLGSQRIKKGVHEGIHDLFPVRVGRMLLHDDHPGVPGELRHVGQGEGRVERNVQPQQKRKVRFIGQEVDPVIMEERADASVMDRYVFIIKDGGSRMSEQTLPLYKKERICFNEKKGIIRSAAGTSHFQVCPVFGIIAAVAYCNHGSLSFQLE